MKQVEIYADGSCLGNPGPGGWCCILKYGEAEKQLSGYDIYSTNNIMELTAVIAGLRALKQSCIVDVITDSKYAVDAFEKGWIYNWKREGFKNRKNAGLWMELLSLTERHQVKFNWIKGHAGHHYNEICDSVARSNALEAKRIAI